MIEMDRQSAFLFLVTMCAWHWQTCIVIARWFHYALSLHSAINIYFTMMCWSRKLVDCQFKATLFNQFILKQQLHNHLRCLVLRWVVSLSQPLSLVSALCKMTLWQNFTDSTNYQGFWNWIIFFNGFWFSPLTSSGCSAAALCDLWIFLQANL